ncbi:MAG: response regulator transcription factor [Clostridia bacterium]|nr:response regulator transcription factor [Clostridia bacterium]
MKILIVDDEKLLVKGLKFNFEQDGYTVLTAFDGEEAVRLGRDKTLDIIVLDLMLPKMDGLTVCQKIRETSNVPIIMLTAKSDDMDKIMGLEYGADDYMTKPFNILELKARVKAVLRRKGKPASQESAKTADDNKGVVLNKFSRSLKVDGHEIELTVKEYAIMELFIANPGRVYSRDDLLDIIWGYDYPGDVRTVDVHMRRLREKVEPNPASPKYILTKWGVGYYFKEA